MVISDKHVSMTMCPIALSHRNLKTVSNDETLEESLISQSGYLRRG
jgi:hypothetical protein